MKKRQFAIIAAFLMFWSSISIAAEGYETLCLKDGSIVTGYIASKIPGVSIRFEASEAKIVVPNDFVRDMDKDDVEYFALPIIWKNYTKNDSAILKEKDGKQYLTLAKVNLLMPEDSSALSVIRRKLFNQVRTEFVVPIKSGENSVTYLDISHKTYIFDYNEISSIKYPKRPSDVAIGLEDIVRTRDGREYVGQIVFKKIGESIQVLQNNGELVTILGKDIISYTKRNLVTEKRIEEQAEKLDYVYVGNMEYPGIIIYQDFGSEGQKPYLKLWENNGERRFEFEEIKRIERRDNPYYKEIRVETISGNDVKFNGKISKAIPCYKEKDGRLVINGIDNSVIIAFGQISGNLTVELINSVKGHQTALYPLKKYKGSKYIIDSDVPMPLLQIPEVNQLTGLLNMTYQIPSPGLYIFCHFLDGVGNVVEIQ